MEIYGAYDCQESFVEFLKPMMAIEHNGLLFEPGKTKPCAQKLGGIWFCLSSTKLGPKPTYRIAVGNG